MKGGRMKKRNKEFIKGIKYLALFIFYVFIILLILRAIGRVGEWWEYSGSIIDDVLFGGILFLFPSIPLTISIILLLKLKFAEKKQYQNLFTLIVLWLITLISMVLTILVTYILIFMKVFPSYLEVIFFLILVFIIILLVYCWMRIRNKRKTWFVEIFETRSEKKKDLLFKISIVGMTISFMIMFLMVTGLLYKIRFKLPSYKTVGENYGPNFVIVNSSSFKSNIEVDEKVIDKWKPNKAKWVKYLKYSSNSGIHISDKGAFLWKKDGNSFNLQSKILTSYSAFYKGFVVEDMLFLIRADKYADVFSVFSVFEMSIYRIIQEKSGFVFKSVTGADSGRICWRSQPKKYPDKKKYKYARDLDISKNGNWLRVADNYTSYYPTVKAATFVTYREYKYNKQVDMFYFSNRFVTLSNTSFEAHIILIICLIILLISGVLFPVPFSKNKIK